MRFLALILPVLVLGQYAVPVLETPPSIDGVREAIWDEALRIDLGKYVVGIELLRVEDKLYSLLKLKESALKYIGKSYYLYVSFGNSCYDFEYKILIPFKVWRGRGYLFKKVNGAIELTGFEGIGLGEYVEMSFPFESVTVCFEFVDSRTKDTLEIQGLKIGR